MAKKNWEKKEREPSEFKDQVISINRCSKVVKGGRNFSFGALIVVGNEKGRVGYGYGKANEVSDAIRKGGEIAKKSLITVPINGSTIPHAIIAKYSGAKVLVRPASPGTGLIAGGAMRAVLGLAGVKDILAKSLGSNNPLNVVKATFEAILSLRSKEEVLEKRGIENI